MFFYEWTKVKEKRIARKEVWAKLRNWNKKSSTKNRNEIICCERERAKEREWERMRERERESIRDQPKREKKMACNGVDCRGGSFFFFIYTLKQKKKKQWRKWDISASTYFATEYRINNLTCIILTGTSCDMYKTCRFRFSRIFDLPCFF